MSQNEPNRDEKKNSPGGFLVFLIAMMLMMLMYQNMNRDHTPGVAFKHQIEHLVNLDLLKKDDSRLTPSGENTVAFSGRFKESLSPESRASYKYLDLLNIRNSLIPEKVALEENLPALQKMAKQSAEMFLALVGKVPARGLDVVHPVFDTDAHSHSIIVDNSDVENFKYKNNLTNVKSIAQLEGVSKQLQAQSSDVQVEGFGQDILALTKWFRSERLALSKDYLEKVDKVRAMVSNSLNSDTPSQAQLATFTQQLNILKEMTAEMQKESHDARLTGLLTVSNYKTKLLAYNGVIFELSENSEALNKARAPVERSTWFFNDKEITTKQLESQNPEMFTAWYTGAKGEWNNFETNKGAFFKASNQARNNVLDKNFKADDGGKNIFKYLLPFAPILLIMGLLYMGFSKQMKGGPQGAMNFGKSPAKLLTRDMLHATFVDVAGCDEAKEELQEIVDFLKDPERYTRLGARIPKGALLVGSPGTGKTLIARATAGEANVPFFTISGSDFVEMFVGVGAKRIRDMFQQAKENSPCIIFIDEIDAVGRQRGAGVGGGHDEREQTLNQLLVEMDGFSQNDNVILIAATNRPDVLDKALMRPGRFDRQVTVELPDLKGRYEILKVHAKKVKLDDKVNLMDIARSTPGVAGADLGNVINEAALLAARTGKSAIGQIDLTDSRDKVLYGKERRSLEMDRQELLATAYHESGHALVALNVKHSDTVNKVTIIPRGMSLGATHFAPKKNRVSYSRDEALDQIAILMGGRAAEEIFLKDQLSGCQQDFDQATKLARAMVCQWGMTDELGRVAYDERNAAGQYSGASSTQEKAYSEETAQKIDAKVQEFVDGGYERAVQILKENKDKTEQMTQLLMKFETLELEDVKAIQEGVFDEKKKEELLLVESEKKMQVPPPPPPSSKSVVEDQPDTPANPA